jgi:DnaJ-class molecular chaperone
VNIEDLFGGGGGFDGDLGDLFGRGRRRGPVKGQDLEQELTIDFESAVRGTALQLRSADGETVYGCGFRRARTKEAACASRAKAAHRRRVVHAVTSFSRFHVRPPSVLQTLRATISRSRSRSGSARP